MTVSKNGSRGTGAADPSSDPEQARSLAVAPLRQRMIGDMELAGLGLSTQQCYLRAVGRCSDIPTHAPAGSPRTRSIQYVLWLRDTKGVTKGVTKGTFQPHWYGIKFFYYRTLGVDWPLFTRKKVRQPRHQRLPQAIAWDDGRRLIAEIRKPGYRLCYSFMLGLGLRISDAVNLSVQATIQKT